MPILSKDQSKYINSEELFDEYHSVISIPLKSHIKEEKRILWDETIYIHCDHCGRSTTKKYGGFKKQLIKYNNEVYCKSCLAGKTNLELHGDWNYCNKDKILATTKYNKDNPKIEEVKPNSDELLIQNYLDKIKLLEKPVLLKVIAEQISCDVKVLISKLTKYKISHNQLMNEMFTTPCKMCGKSIEFSKAFCSRLCQSNYKNKKHIFDIKLQELQELQKLLDITMLSYYKDVGTKVKCKCNKCNTVWETMPGNLLNSKGCPICERTKNMGYSEDVFLDKVKQNSPQFEILDTNYIKNKPSKVKCTECGVILEINKKALRSGVICKYCKSKVKSNPEILIENYLKSKNYNYEYQKTFHNLKGKRGKFFRYDFYLFDYNLCIEYDGEGHFKSDFYLNKTGVLDYTNDIIKEKYCNDNNIKLLRIPYWERKDMIEYLDLFLVELKDFNSVITNNYRGKEYKHLEVAK